MYVHMSVCRYAHAKLNRAVGPPTATARKHIKFSLLASFEQREHKNTKQKATKLVASAQRA